GHTGADVSIVIPVFGQLAYVLNCLDSLARHRSRFTFELMLVDDASPLETQIDKLAGLPWIRYRRLPTNVGFIDACNEGAIWAKGKYIVLLNSDTRVVDGWLDELIGTFAIFPNAG